MSRTEVRENTDDRTEARRRVESELLNGTLDFDREIGRLKAICEETRFTILYLIATEDGIHSGELAHLLNRKQNDLYHHLNELEAAGLVGKYRADNGGRIYELSPLAERIVPTIFDSIRRRAEAV
ncbi:MAG: helix-turn-helix domain-containing protein [Halobacteriota archaeon]